jgi:hypothetical protein
MGYQPLALDGPVSIFLSDLDLPLTPRIGRHRPDALARSTDGQAAVCEAKTWVDLASSRTVEQLEDFLSPWDEGEYSLVLFGFPSSVDDVAQAQIRRAGALGCTQLMLMPVPDEVLCG